MKKTFYRLSGKPLGRSARIALVSDLHAQTPDGVLEALKDVAPDYILLAGDILEALDGSLDSLNERAFGIFKGCADIAPTFYCTGNHEDGGVHSGSRKWQKCGGRKREYTKENLDRISSSGVRMLFNSCTLCDGIAFGGLMSGLICKNGEPDLSFLHSFSKADAPKVLICHHPEYYEKYVKALDFDLVVSGHAHGGQWRIFGRGVYAPGQGLFPKYTAGVHDNRLVISRGLKKGIIPRFFNPTEIEIIDL
jgi:predicted MPP superfamily phosphohydrolase